MCTRASFSLYILRLHKQLLLDQTFERRGRHCAAARRCSIHHKERHPRHPLSRVVRRFRHHPCLVCRVLGVQNRGVRFGNARLHRRVTKIGGVRVLAIAKVMPERDVRKHVLHGRTIVFERVQHECVHQRGIGVPVGLAGKVNPDLAAGVLEALRSPSLRRGGGVLCGSFFWHVGAQEERAPSDDNVGVGLALVDVSDGGVEVALADEAPGSHEVADDVHGDRGLGGLGRHGCVAAPGVVGALFWNAPRPGTVDGKTVGREMHGVKDCFGTFDVFRGVGDMNFEAT